ncbi:MAG: AMP-binding protein [Burkholderiaceae bacterium]|nr:AMP-binding protein [Burkholderiaceae bacterium]
MVVADRHAREAAARFAAERTIAAAGDVWLAQGQSAGALIRRTGQRLRSLVDFARAAAPLYRRLYAGLPDAAHLPLAALPVVTKPMLMQDLEAGLTVRDLPRAQIDRFLQRPPDGRLLRDRYAVWTSSGTTGVPGIFLHDRAALAIYDALEACRFRGLHSPAQVAAHLLDGDRYALVAATGGHFAGAASVERLRRNFPWLAGRVRVFSLLAPLPQLVAQLNDYAPTLLATYPTAADLLADEQRAGRLRLRLAELWTGGECLCEAVRARLARVFGCRVRNGYGASEFLAIAAECDQGVLHVNADWAIIEPVDAAYRVLDPGETSQTALLTNLANGVQPLIRYDLGDAITILPEPCACGSALPALRVEGRRDDVLVCPDARGAPVKLLPLVLTTVLEDVAHVHDFQLVQRAPAELRLRLAAAARGAAARAQAALAAYLSAQGLAHVRVVLDDGPPQRERASGKLRRVVREAAPSDGAAAESPPCARG